MHSESMSPCGPLTPPGAACASCVQEPVVRHSVHTLVFRSLKYKVRAGFPGQEHTASSLAQADEPKPLAMGTKVRKALYLALYGVPSIVPHNFVILEQ